MESMMRNKLTAATAALMLLCVIGCSKEEPDEAILQEGKPVAITLQTQGNDITDFAWRSGDALSVSVYGVNSNQNCKLIADAGGKNTPFSGSVIGWGSATKNIYSFYPYSPIVHNIDGGDNIYTAISTLTLPNPQTYTIGEAVSNNFIVGAGTATTSGKTILASVDLKRVMSIIKLNITNAPGKVTGVCIYSDNAIFPTTATVSMSSAVISNPDKMTKRLSVNVTDPTSEPNKYVQFALFPGETDQKVNVSVSFEGGEGIETETSIRSFQRSSENTINIDATGALIRVGSFYMKDNTIIDCGIVLNETQKANCMGIVFDVNNVTKSGRIVGLIKVSKPWTTEVEYDIPELSLLREIDGYQNMAQMSTIADWETKFPPFGWVHSLNPPGTDYLTLKPGIWFLPSDYEMCDLYTATCGIKNNEYEYWHYHTYMPHWRLYEKKRQAFNDLIISAGGMGYDFDEYYWSSVVGYHYMEAMAVGFSDGAYLSRDMHLTRSVRPIAYFQLPKDNVE